MAGSSLAKCFVKIK